MTTEPGAEVEAETEELVWTGDNLEELTAFAERGSFGLVVGSNEHRYRWWHRLYNWVILKLPEEWEPPEDPRVLEVYPAYDDGGVRLPYYTPVQIGDAVRADGFVRRGAR